jgi:phage-related minor tail protein
MGVAIMGEGGIVNSPTAALIGEAGPEAVIPLNRMGSMGGSTVNIVVNGSVTSEGDLVNSIRNAILQGQNNGQAITKTAIQL